MEVDLANRSTSRSEKLKKNQFKRSWSGNLQFISDYIILNNLKRLHLVIVDVYEIVWKGMTFSYIQNVKFS